MNTKTTSVRVLPPEARAALIECRNELRLHKKLGIITAPEKDTE